MSFHGREALVGKNTNFRRCCNWENAQLVISFLLLLNKVKMSLKRSQKKSQTKAEGGDNWQGDVTSSN